VQDVQEALGSRVHKNDRKEDKNATTTTKFSEWPEESKKNEATMTTQQQE
jgi:hypothetical protein